MYTFFGIADTLKIFGATPVSSCSVQNGRERKVVLTWPEPARVDLSILRTLQRVAKKKSFRHLQSLFDLGRRPRKREWRSTRNQCHVERMTMQLAYFADAFLVCRGRMTIRWQEKGKTLSQFLIIHRCWWYVSFDKIFYSLWNSTKRWQDAGIHPLWHQWSSQIKPVWRYPCRIML